jgi:hypothetical protein
MLSLFIGDKLDNTLGTNQTPLNGGLRTTLFYVELVCFVPKVLYHFFRCDSAHTLFLG